MSTKFRFVFILLIISKLSFAQVEEKVFPGADKRTPSRAQYFSWINNTNEGATEEQTLINLEFFKWLHDEYGMVLDIYAFDAGAIDGKGFYGSIYSDRFKAQFPNGFDPVYNTAKDIGTRLGVWGGPDGFGDTPEEEKARIDMMVKLCRDYDFMLFKFDAVSGSLREEKQDAFVRMMKECRLYSPDLILLNHRLRLGKGLPYATTSLWEGAETYIDVWMSNRTTGTHHRVGALSRGLPPDLMRLTEDHGVCLSSCLDYWEDDLILQAFNRCLILAPEIYANPWLLRDDEFPKLARIYNLHRKYRDILVNGFILPEKNYGPNAVSRGDGNTRLITLRNLNWEPVKYRIQLDEEIGLTGSGKVELRQFHPSERIIGKFDRGGFAEIEVPPFRSCLVAASTMKIDEIGVEGCNYEIVRDTPDKPVVIKLLGMPGEEAEIKLMLPEDSYNRAMLDGSDAGALLNAESLEITFPGSSLKDNFHRKLGGLVESEIPEDAEALYEATCFAADNNALEVRSLYRSGSTNIPQVQKARDAFFEQEVFVERGIWDKNLFDGDMNTSFYVNRRFGRDLRINGGTLRIDFGQKINIDRLVIHVKTEQALQPLKRDEALRVEVSDDLKNWKRVFLLAGKTMELLLNDNKPVRYIRFYGNPEQIFEVEGFYRNRKLDSSKWRASNLFAAFSRRFRPQRSWKSAFVLDEIPKNSYLAVAINGEHGVEGAYAAAKIGGEYIGAPDRAVSYPSNTWEYYARQYDRNYTYYIPLNESMTGKEIEVFVLGMNPEKNELHPELWITSYPVPYEEKELILYR
ncbi:discoidin domain-containing protein [candidate division KSB1 bacterium]